MDETLNVAGTVLLAAAVAVGWSFLLAYSLLRWWETPAGWYVWTSNLILTVILTYNLVATLGWVAGEWRVGARLLIYAGALTIMVWKGSLLVAAQYELYLQSLKRTTETTKE